MHFEILVEDQSGKKALDILVPKIIGLEHTCKVIAYKGVGRIPKNMNAGVDASKRMLLDNLPRLLQGCGKSWTNYPAAVFVVCDLDDKCFKRFRQELYAVLGACDPQPETRFCIAVEEGEAWLLGDIPAIKAAYPNMRMIPYAEPGSVWRTRCTKAVQPRLPPKVGRRLVPKSRSGLKRSRLGWTLPTMHRRALYTFGENCLNLLIRRNDVVRRKSGL